MTQAPAQGRRIFHGWFVTAAVGLILTATAGLCFYGTSVYLEAFVTDSGFSVSVASGATAVFFVVSGVAGTAVAYLMTRCDVRWIMITGAIGCGVLLAGIGQVTTVERLYAFYTLLGICYAACGLVPTTTVIMQWFDRRRSLALSWASTGLSLGGVLLTPLVVWLVAERGLAHAGPWLGALLVLMVVPVTWAVVRAQPADMGLGVDGADPPAGPATARDGVPFADALASRFFICVTAAWICAMAAQVGSITHLFTMASGRAGTSVGAAAVAVMAGGSLAGRLAGGFALMRISVRRLAAGLFLMQTAAVCLLALAHAPAALLASALLFGITVGNVLMMQPLILGEAFGVRDYGRIYAAGQMFMTIGGAGGPVLMGLLYDFSGSYQIPYLAAAAAALAALAFLATAPALTPPLRGGG